jgi:hypothetical protein
MKAGLGRPLRTGGKPTPAPIRGELAQLESDYGRDIAPVKQAHEEAQLSDNADLYITVATAWVLECRLGVQQISEQGPTCPPTTQRDAAAYHGHSPDPATVRLGRMLPALTAYGHVRPLDWHV